LRLGSTFRNLVIQSRIQISFVQDTANYIDLGINLCLTRILVRHLAHHGCILDPFFSQTEFKHLNSFNQVLIDAFLRPKHALQLVYSLSHLALLKQIFCLFGKRCSLHVLKGSNYLIKRDLLARTAAVLVGQRTFD